VGQMTPTTPYDLVLSHYDFPFPLYPFQVEAVNDLAPRKRSGLYLHPGLGKTAVSTICALYKMIMGEVQGTLGIMPPLLVAQWARWLSRVKHKDGRPLRVTKYQGSPAQRKDLDLDVDFLLMGVQIFKRDFCSRKKNVHGHYDFITTKPLPGKKWHILMDEAQAIKSVESAIYHHYSGLVEDESHQLLTGTPLNVPEDAYAYINLITPGLYRTLLDFEQTHIWAKGAFDKAVEYVNLDTLTSNLLFNSFLRTKEDVLPDLPECIISDIEYELDSPHMALYRKMATHKLLEWKEEQKLDLTQATALYHALGQIVCQWHYFGQDETLKSKVYSLIEEVLEELGDKKLIIFSNYQRTNEEIVRRFKCPGIWGQVSPGQKQRNLNKFLDDPKCRILAANPLAAGQGVDGCQHVCQDVLYTEPPITPSHWVQSLSRVHREGQRNAVTVRMAVAKGTLQRHLVNQLADKEALIMPVQKAIPYLTVSEIRKIVFGEE